MKKIGVNLVGVGRRMTGVERYTLELVPRLLTLRPNDVQLSLFGDPQDVRRIRSDVGEKLQPTDRIVSLGNPVGGSVGRHIVTQFRLPAALHAARIDALLSPMNVGPLSFRRQAIVIHDVAWMQFPDAYRPSYRLLHRLLTAGYRLRNLTIVADSHSAARDLRAAFPHNTIHVARCGPGKTPPSSKGPSAPRVPRQVLWFGSIQPRKDLPTAIAACGRAARMSGEPIRLVVAGGGGSAFEPTIIDHAEGLDVVHQEHPSDDEVESLYRTSSVLLHTSLYEGFGLTVLEALVRGLPVVSSDLPALRELRLDGVIYCTAGQPDSFAVALTQCLSHQPREVPSPVVSWDQTAAEVWEVLLKLVRERSTN